MMKTFFILFAMTFMFSCQEEPRVDSSLSEDAVKKSETSALEGFEDPEDCDEKAKKVEEVVEVNLGESGDAGCSIE